MRKALTILFFNFSVQLLFAQTPIPNISDADKILGLSMFWKEASYNFVYFDKVPKLNWDSAYASFIPKVLATKNIYEYSRQIKKFSALLHDGHTSAGYYVDTLIYQNDFGKYKLELKEFDEKVYVINTALKTKDEIPVGSEILLVDNIPVETYLTDSVLPYICSSTDYIRREDAVSNLLQGLKGTSFKIQIKTPENKISELHLTRALSNDKWQIEHKVNKLIDFKMLNSQIAYVALNSFRLAAIDSLFEAIIPELAKCKGLIIDIRENEGGNGYFANEILKHLTDKPYFLCEHSSTRKSLSAYKAWGVYAEQNLIKAKCNLDSSSTEFKENYKTSSDFRKMIEYYLHLKGRAMEDEANDTVYNKDKSDKLLMPLVVLIGHNTASASEDFLMGLDYLKRATFFGQKTYGSTGQPFSFVLPDNGFARVCALKCTYPDGREFVGVGIKPDVEINPTLKDYLDQTDTTLIQATIYLTKLLGQTDNLKQKIIYDTLSTSRSENSDKLIINRTDSVYIHFDDGFYEEGYHKLKVDLYINNVLYKSDSILTNSILGYAATMILPKYKQEERIQIKSKGKIIADFILDNKIPVIHFSNFPKGTSKIIFTNKRWTYM